MDKIDDGEFQAIQFYLKNADSDNWADRSTIDYKLNLSNVLQEAQSRVIEGKSERIGEPKEQFLIKELPDLKQKDK